MPNELIIIEQGGPPGRSPGELPALVRGDIKSAERADLDSDAQPLQRLLDHIIYAMAGLSESEWNGLEERFSHMP